MRVELHSLALVTFAKCLFQVCEKVALSESLSFVAGGLACALNDLGDA